MTTEDLAAAWETLASASMGQGSVYRRLHANSSRDLRAVLDLSTGARSLVFQRPWRPNDQLPELVQSEAVQLRAERSPDGVSLTLAVVLVDDDFRDVFSILAEDVAACVALSQDDDTAMSVLMSRLEHWRELLRDAGAHGLTPTWRRGLFGELQLLQMTLLPLLAPRTALSGWTGPRRANQDFQFPSLAIEVKTTSGQQPQALVVTNERELDATGVGDLFLAHLSIDERLGGQGVSLNSAVEGIRHLLGDDATALRLFRVALGLYGYFPQHQHLYDEPRYAVRETNVYAVKDGFPRITEAHLPNGVGAVRYSISLSACLDFLTAPGTLEQKLLAGGGA